MKLHEAPKPFSKNFIGKTSLDDFEFECLTAKSYSSHLKNTFSIAFGTFFIHLSSLANRDLECYIRVDEGHNWGHFYLPRISARNDDGCNS